MILRPASFADAENLARLGRESFCHAFEHLYRAEDLRVFLEEVYCVEAVRAAIGDPAFTHRLAEDEKGSGLTGFIKVKQPSPYAVHSDASRPLCLGQLYTDPARTGEGIGAALMEWCLAFAKQQACDAVQLSVYSDNRGAQRFYHRYGFGKKADIDFWVGRQRDHEFLYELRI